MNDFTKEELEGILEGLSWWLEGDDALCSERLINKIQSLIDDYCEHKWHSNPYNYVLHCQKCGKTTPSDNQGRLLENE